MATLFIAHIKASRLNKFKIRKGFDDSDFKSKAVSRTGPPPSFPYPTVTLRRQNITG